MDDQKTSHYPIHISPPIPPRLGNGIPHLRDTNPDQSKEGKTQSTTLWRKIREEYERSWVAWCLMLVFFIAVLLLLIFSLRVFVSKENARSGIVTLSVSRMYPADLLLNS